MVKIILLIGFLIMLYNLFSAIGLRSKAPGGIIGNRLAQLTIFIGVFAAGYLAVGVLIFNQGATTLLLILSLILLFGAVFVLLVLNLVQAILEAINI